MVQRLDGNGLTTGMVVGLRYSLNPSERMLLCKVSLTSLPLAVESVKEEIP